MGTPACTARMRAYLERVVGVCGVEDVWGEERACVRSRPGVVEIGSRSDDSRARRSCGEYIVIVKSAGV